MQQIKIAAAIAVAFGLTAHVHAQVLPAISASTDGWTYSWDSESLLENDSYLVTSIPMTFTGSNVATLVGANTFYNAGITGQNTITSNIEAGHIWGGAAGQESLTHVTSLTNSAAAPGGAFGTPAYDRHATWVGMMIGGRQGGAIPGIWEQGIAPQTDLRSGAIATGWVAPANTGSFSSSVATLDFPYSSAVSGFGTADVINSSWGFAGTGAGSFERQGRDVRSMITDSLANGNRFTTFVAAAGNDGINIGTNSVGAPGAGYNGITVGALQNNGSDSYNAVAGFSSRGPQDYGDPVNGLIAAGRAAVDIVAPGTTLTSAFYGGQTGQNDASLAGSANTPGVNLYSSNLLGTSFASPITAGGVSLMHSAAVANGLPADSRDTRVIKANLLNSASKIAGWNNGQVAHPNGNNGVRTTQALDFNSGTGALNLDQTFTQYLSGQTDIAGTNGGTTNQTIGWDYADVTLSGSTDVVITQSMPAGSTFNATLSWFRERTYANAFSQTDVGFADLDLQIWDDTFTTLYSDSISTFTPVEHLSFTLPVTGKYGIRVTYPQNVFGNISTEQFGLAWSGVAIPEPTAILLLMIGLGAVSTTVRRRD